MSFRKQITISLIIVIMGVGISYGIIYYKNIRLASEEDAYNQGLIALEKGDWNKAKELLSKVSKDSPYYQKAQSEIKEADNKITEEKINKAVEAATRALQEETKKAQQQATEAKQKVKAAEEAAGTLKEQTEKAKQEVAEAKQKAEEANQALQQEKSKEADLSSIVSQWKPLVGLVYCEFRYSDTFYKYLSKSGSGIAIKFPNQPLSIITNKHVVTDALGYGAYACAFAFPDHSYIYKNDGNWEGIKVYSGLDAALVNVSNADRYLLNLTASFPKLCQNKPSEGDKVVILGYPAIGSSEGITVTQGIISGFEGNYFITDAKIDAGTSGGAAILVKDNCLLGLPTYGVIGEAESLGRILDFNVLVPK
jgi:S1-C subfamily serine protease